jgi:hypothetical protein
MIFQQSGLCKTRIHSRYIFTAAYDYASQLIPNVKQLRFEESHNGTALATLLVCLALSFVASILDIALGFLSLALCISLQAVQCISGVVIGFMHIVI